MIGTLPRVVMVTALVWASGCASGLSRHARLGDSFVGADREGWNHLANGEGDRALAIFGRQLSQAPDDVVARLGVFAVAHARADAATALGHALAVLESVAAGRAPVGGGEAAVAVAGVLDELLDEAGDQNAQTRILDLLGQPDSALPWQARFVLVRVADEWARRAGDGVALKKLAGLAGCPEQVRFTGPLGRLPLGDLVREERDLPPRRLPGAAAAQPGAGVTVSGCRIALYAADTGSGVLRLEAEMHPGPGARALVLDYPGIAALRVDGGPWQHHGSVQRHAAAWSAHAFKGGATHKIEIRLASYDGSAYLGLALLADAAGSAAGRDIAADVGGDADGARVDEAPGLISLRAYTAGLSAAVVGDSQHMLLAARALEAQSRFAPGAVLAGWLLAADPTRPSHMARDRARAQYRRAVALDETLARSWLELARLEQAEGRSRDAARLVERARTHAPNAWPVHQEAHDIFASMEVERAADEALDRALAVRESSHAVYAGCEVLEAAATRARRRKDSADERRRSLEAARCDARSSAVIESLRTAGKLDQAIEGMRTAVAVSFPDQWAIAELASLLLVAGRHQDAIAVLQEALHRTPRETSLHIRLADAFLSRGNVAGAHAVLRVAQDLLPSNAELREAARALHLPLPLADHRVDGREILRGYDQSGQKHESPAVVLLDRLVERFHSDGSSVALTHMIVRVQSKDAIARWGEVNVPAGAQVLTLRTLKADGRVLEPEDIAGKETVSAPELGPGDSVEWETLEWRGAADAFAPGFVGSRFYFRSLEAPLGRSEYVLITPPDLPPSSLQVDRRAGAPQATGATLPNGWHVSTFLATQAAQAFPEAAGAAVRDWVPSVRVAHQLDVGVWGRYLGDRLAPVVRSNPELQRLAARLAQEAGAAPMGRIEATVRWVGKNIESEGGIEDPATFTLARGRGNRLGLMSAIAREMGLDVQTVFARSLLTASASEPVLLQDLEDFAQPLLAFFGVSGTQDPLYVDARLRHAPPGYLAPGLEGAPVLVLGQGVLATARGQQGDARTVQLEAKIGAAGDAHFMVDEKLHGLPAMQWAETIQRVGGDRDKLRRQFEEAWLSPQFPGAILEDLQVDADPPGQGAARLRYTFGLARFALARDGGMVVIPEFFLASPGRRFASEPRRRTPLLMGYEVPFDLHAVLTLPEGSTVVDAGQDADITVSQFPGLHFRERRSVSAQPGAPTVEIHRLVRSPIARVTPAEYPPVADRLRQVDPAQSSPIRIRLQPGR